MTSVQISLQGHNPDVLSCIANLSNDAVTTAPELANQMLDNLELAWAEANDGASIWSDRTLRFLDPATKSGVFVREIVRRLTAGLADEIPNLEDRVDHILTQQVFGLAVTELHGLMSRRSVYCTKYANGEHSIAKSFTTRDGNLWFERTEHSWTGGKREFITDPLTGQDVEAFTNRRCQFCGATEEELGRGQEAESHAYAFIHTDDIKSRLTEIFGADMHFDVIIGNPPYQLNDGGFGTSAAPIYQKFVEQAKALEPRFLSLVIPSRWFSGGKHLDDFRESMLSDNRVRSIDDYLTASDVFPEIGLKGGVCYFLWDRDNPGDCRVTTRFKDWPASTATRPLLEPGADVFIRFNEGLSILQKVAAVEGGPQGSVGLPEGKRFEALVSSRKPFGLTTTFKGKVRRGKDDLKVYQNGGAGYTPKSTIAAGGDLVDSWKLFVGYAAPGTGNKDTYPHRIISTPFIGEPGSISSETYLCIGPFETEAEATSALSYLRCRLTRFLILLRKSSQHVTRKVYGFVPTQDWSKQWTDAELYERYGLTQDEIDFVERIVRPLEGKE
ncbi:Eco57I restriction-modification methylase domain-containing protein [Ornithinimicrobium cerasi]|uniref:Site-specific DNA-methyltransferase (Adenine-specific) n=1 Tax=Ornithinimicrobium cerasi TaxID=2248773 RepID=A0A285VAW2_9MICO|nr:Eco57I restriction-modification methylase domain-containing protein [Ornithinimicrobium cerasi]SOC51143.1 site-specific DNA-methyltransferase (adenine-specific) [Ornithinimicrobium cerasi]